MMRWHNVNDQLPQSSQIVLAIGLLHWGLDYPEGPRYLLAIYENRRWCWNDGGEIAPQSIEILRWAPLPDIEEVL